MKGLLEDRGDARGRFLHTDLTAELHSLGCVRVDTLVVVSGNPGVDLDDEASVEQLPYVIVEPVSGNAEVLCDLGDRPRGLERTEDPIARRIEQLGKDARVTDGQLIGP